VLVSFGSAPILVEMGCDLYPRVVGDAWWTLAEPLRRAHTVGGDKCGFFRVSHGTGWLVRRLVARSGLPRASSRAKTRLRIVTEGAGQRWEREFDDEAFTTRQWAEGDGCLVERFGAWELCFNLRVDEQTLRYVQCGARLCFGTFRLPLPLNWAPLVSATETCDGPERVLVAVTVTLPLMGMLVSYEGHLDVGGPA